MKKQPSYKIPIATIALIACLSSCGTKAPQVDYRALAQASVQLGMDVGFYDNHRLYLESSKWIGVPYRSGGTNMRGVDCSGLTTNIYKKVFNRKLKRSTDEQMNQTSKIARRNLKEGDLLFFSSRNSKKKVAHVGIYLKDGKFIHASSSRGVVISNLDETYYKTHWMRGGRLN